MKRKVAWLSAALLTMAGLAAQAQIYTATPGPVRRGQPVSTPRSVAPPAVHEGQVVVPTDRFLAPDQMDNNTIKILRTTNKAQVNSYVPVVFRLHNVNPYGVIRFLRRPVEQEEGLIFTFVNPDGDGGLVLYAVPLYMVDGLHDLVNTVDRPGLTSSAGDARIYRQLQHRRADYSDPDFLDTAASFLTGDGVDFIPDPKNNALYYADSPAGAANLDNALTDFLDKPTAMVQVELKAYEINSTNDDTIGLDYINWKNGPGSTLFTLGAFAEHGSVLHSTGGASIPPIDSGAAGLPRNNFTANGWNGAWQYNVPSQFFDFLAVKGKARILNETRLAVLNTHRASFSTGDEILYYETSTAPTDGIRSTGEIFKTGDRQVNPAILSQDASMHVSVRPRIGEQEVQLRLDIDWADFNGLDGRGVPAVTRRHLDSTVRTAVNDEIMLGGFNRVVRAKASTKVPLLGSLPIIGYLFGGETNQTQKQEVILAIKPVGIMSYDVAKDYKVDTASSTVIKKADGSQEIVEPTLPWGFDQLFLDHEKTIKEPLNDNTPGGQTVVTK